MSQVEQYVPPLTPAERAEFERLDGIVQKHVNGFVELGEALRVIRDERLYREDFGTFEAYAKEKHDIVASRARQLCLAAETVRSIESVTNCNALPAPKNEAQVRPLLKLDAEEERVSAWQTVIEKAKEAGKKVTQALVGEVVADIKAKKRKKEAVEQSKDIILKKARLVCGDAVEWLEGLPEAHADCCIMDPPYGLEIHRTRSSAKEYADGEEYALDLLGRTVVQLRRVLKPGAHLYVFSGYSYVQQFKDILGEYFDVQDNPLVWKKNGHALGNFKLQYTSTYEFIIFAKHPEGDPRELNADFSKDVVEFDRVEDSEHSAEKPVDLLRYLLENSTQVGNLVIDPFAGMGSTGVAATNSLREFAGSEHDEHFYNSAKIRIAAAEGSQTEEAA